MTPTRTTVTSTEHIDIERERALAELRRDNAAADSIAREAERNRKAQAKDQRRELKQLRRDAARQAVRDRRRARAAGVRAGLVRFRPVAPITLVTMFAMYGQIAYGYDAYTSPAAAMAARLLVAIGAAIAVESISLYVQWHAHVALLMQDTVKATRRRIASYAIALAVAAVNYSHFSTGWSPTPAAVVFGLFSASGPWLWGLHTRRVQHVELERRGHVDSVGAVFSLERWLWFPIRTWHARRWSVDHGEPDPAVAWAGMSAERAARVAQRAAEQAEVDREQRRLGDIVQGIVGGFVGEREQLDDAARKAALRRACLAIVEAYAESGRDRPGRRALAALFPDDVSIHQVRTALDAS